jgi:hypothetical protein
MNRALRPPDGALDPGSWDLVEECRDFSTFQTPACAGATTIVDDGYFSECELDFDIRNT